MSTIEQYSCTKRPLFCESELVERLMACYKVRPITDLVNTNTVIRDNTISFVIVTDSYYVLVLRKHDIHIVVRDNVNVYTDSVMKDTWKMTIVYGSTITFNIKSATCETYLFYIKDNKIHFNASLFKYSSTVVRRIIAVSQ